jgi:predicted nucleic acid-binding protein
MPSKPVGIALDSSCLVALLCDWHECYLRTTQAYQRIREQHARIIIPAHAILECYSVLTRLPAPFRFSTEAARELIKKNFGDAVAIAGTKAGTVWGLIDNLASHGIGGGKVYDALIAWCALDAGASVLLTWNLKHFGAIALPRLEIREP